MNWPLTAVVVVVAATTTNGTSKSNLLFIACLSLALALSVSLTQLFIYTRTVCRECGPITWLSLASFFTSRPLNCANYALTASSSVWTGPLQIGLPLSGNMCAHNWPLLSLMVHRFATRQTASWRSSRVSPSTIPIGLQEKLGILPESWISARKWMRQIKAKCCDGVGKIWEVQKVENDIVRVIYKSP